MLYRAVKMVTHREIHHSLAQRPQMTLCNLLLETPAWKNRILELAREEKRLEQIHVWFLVKNINETYSIKQMVNIFVDGIT